MQNENFVEREQAKQALTKMFVSKSDGTALLDSVLTIENQIPSIYKTFTQSSVWTNTAALWMIPQSSQLPTLTGGNGE